MPFSSENFIQGHAIRSNKFPKGLKVEEFSKFKPQIDLETLGLFDTATPNFNTFYPEVSPEDLQPKDEDFVYPVYRALSETRVNKYGPINFGKTKALKASLKKLIGQTVYANHEDSIGNELGVIQDAWWEESFEQDGVTIPAGINVRLKIDGKANPKTARGTMMDPPSIHSVSVGVEFKWEQSHASLTSEEFWNKLGTFDAKGELIERIVVDIIDFHEISFVNHGADPYAQRVTAEGINNPGYADRRVQNYRFSADDFRKLPHKFDWKHYKVDNLAFSAPDQTIPNNLNKQNKQNQNNFTMDEQQLVYWREKLGLAKDAPAELVSAKLSERFGQLLTAEADLTTTKQTLTALQQKYPEGSEILSVEQKTRLTAFDNIVKQTREETLKFYNLSTQKPEESITKLIAEGGYETVLALGKQYKELAESKHELSCNSCGSKNVSRGSSEQKEDFTGKPGANGAQGNATPKSNAEVVANLGATIGKPTNGIHED